MSFLRRSTALLSHHHALLRHSPLLPSLPSFTRRALMILPSPPLEELDEPMDEPIEKLGLDISVSAISQITKAQAASKDPLLALRISVESGGCHGYQYKMVTTSTREPDDFLFQPPAPHPPARIVVDPSSLALLSGSTIDYATELIGSSFRIMGNPHASDKGGCGCGVSWELKE